MGRMIEAVALERGDTVTCRIDRDNQKDFDSEVFLGSDVAIEFSTPATAVANIERCFAAGIPVVCGTTGWTARLDEMKRKCEETGGALMWASNYSVGVNIFMALNRYLARIMSSFPQYAPSIVETHHIHKLDHPSGTAITLAEEIEAADPAVIGWKEPDGAAEPGILEISHRREGEVPGIHTITWDSDVDTISMTHSAKSRAGFALGAVMAAEWLAGRKGWHTPAEMFNDITKQDFFS